jgi:hypothetical protein
LGEIFGARIPFLPMMSIIVIFVEFRESTLKQVPIGPKTVPCKKTNYFFDKDDACTPGHTKNSAKAAQSL